MECHCEGFLRKTSEGAVLEPETRKSTLPELKTGKLLTVLKIKDEIPFFGENLRAFKDGFFGEEEEETGEESDENQENSDQEEREELVDLGPEKGRKVKEGTNFIGKTTNQKSG